MFRSCTLRFAGLVLAFCFVRSSTALDPGKTLMQYAHRIWGQEEGLFQPTVYSILQTKDGFLWLGTQDSLIRFDGVHFREFESSVYPEAFHRTLFRSLLEDKRGNLWAASVGNGFAEIMPDGSAKRFITKNGSPSDDVFCLSMGRSDDVWACTNKGLAHLNGKVIHTFTVADGLPSNLIRDTCLSADGTRWVAGFDFGLARLSGERYQLYSDPVITPKEIVTALHCSSSDNNVWAGTSTGLVRVLPNGSRRFTTRDGLPDNAVSALAEGRNGDIWIGTNAGVSRYLRGEITTYTTRDGLSHSGVLSLYEDHEGTLWAGTRNGLDQFTDSKVTPYTTSEGLSDNNTGPVLEDKEGRLWIGTLGSGLNSFDGRRFTALTRQNGLLSNTILSLELDASGDLWAGTDKGLNRLRNGHVIQSYNRGNGLSGLEIHALFSDSGGTLWAGTDKGLSRFSGTGFVSSHELPQKDGADVIALAGGTTALFVSTEDSRFFTLRDGKVISYPTDGTRSVDCYLLDKDLHETWMGTLGSGLLRWRRGVFTHVRVKDGLYDNRIYGIARDNSRNFWLASSKGIFRVSQKELDDFADGKTPYVTSIPFSTGQLRFECQSGVQPAVSRTHDGRLWFSTTNGLVVIDPNHLHSNPVPPGVRITSVIVNGQKILSEKQELTLSPLERNIEIRYAGLSFVSPEKVSFQYKLEGFDKSWTDAGSRREAIFTNLPPGPFQFRIRARNADGIWSSQDAVLPFTVEPKLYQRLWFIPALIALIGLAVVGVYRARVHRLRKTFNLVLSERSRIARELHDTLLQGLSGVTMQLQALWTRLPASKEKAMLAEIIEDASKASQEARRSLWDLRTFGSGTRQFSEKLLKMVHQAAAERSLSLILNVPSLSLQGYPETEYQLLRIAGEALSNINAHANANSITVRLTLLNQRLHLVIADDGAGFTPGEQPYGHFGIIGMRERADEIDADLTITSAPGSGTAVSVAVSIRKMSHPAESNATTSV